jgi:hypothetical protein
MDESGVSQGCCYEEQNHTHKGLPQVAARHPLSGLSENLMTLGSPIVAARIHQRPRQTFVAAQEHDDLKAFEPLGIKVGNYGSQ